MEGDEVNPWAHVGYEVTTPNLAPIVQEIVNRPGWTANSALMILFGHVSGSGVRWVAASDHDTPSLTYELMLTPEQEWTPGPGTTSASLDQEGMMCGTCSDEECTGFKGLDKGSLGACAYATLHDDDCGTYFHCDRTFPPCSRGCDCATKFSSPYGGDNCATRIQHPSGADVGIDIYHVDGTATGGGSPGGICDEDTFPDLDTDQDTGQPGVCGECKVLVNNFNGAYESSCINYCASLGRLCVGAWEELGDTCEVAREESCYSPADNWGGTSDALCECGDLGTMPPPPPPPPHLGSASSLCDETKFP